MTKLLGQSFSSLFYFQLALLTPMISYSLNFHYDYFWVCSFSFGSGAQKLFLHRELKRKLTILLAFTLPPKQPKLRGKKQSQVGIILHFLLALISKIRVTYLSNILLQVGYSSTFQSFSGRIWCGINLFILKSLRTLESMFYMQKILQK